MWPLRHARSFAIALFFSIHYEAASCYNAARISVTVGVSLLLSAITREGENVLSEQLLSFCTNGLGIVGTIALLAFTGMVLWYYRGSRMGSIRWHWRNLRLKQLAALACLFFLAM